MSYALGQTVGGSIELGQLARRDPLVAYSSTMASDLVRQAAVRPARERLSWLRGELNKTQPGLGNEAVSKMRELERRGRAPNQALFDGLRLAIANHLASWVEKQAPRGVSGLGAAEDVSAVFCGIMGAGTVGGSIYAASSQNPTGSVAVGNAGSAAMTAAGCNTAALAEQARIAEANARAAEANAAAAASAGQGVQVSAGGSAMTYVAIGAGVLVVGLVGFIALKK